jgi:hypothetical protein
MAGLLVEKVRKMSFWCAESVSSAQMAETGLILSKRVSVGCGGQVNRLTGMLACNKWPTDHLRCEVAGGGWVTGVPG